MSIDSSNNAAHPAGAPFLQMAADAAIAPKEEEPVSPRLSLLFKENAPGGPRQSVTPLPTETIADYNKRWIYDAEKISAKLAKVFQAAQEKIYTVPHVGLSQIWADANPEEFKSEGKIQLKKLLPAIHFGNTLLNTDGVSGVGVCSTQGWRKAMEDAYVFSKFTVDTGKDVKPITMYAVFDGHTGVGCARYLARKIAGHLQKSLEEAFSELPFSEEVIIFNVLTTACVELGEQWAKKNRSARSVALIVLVIGNELWVANVGDSRAILIDGDQIIALSRDAKPTQDVNDVFYKSVIRRGGELYLKKNALRVSPAGCNIAKAVGYSASGSGVNPRAEIIKYSLASVNKKTLILACDGLWDFASSSQVAQSVIQHQATNPDATSLRIAKMLVKKTCRAVQGEGRQFGDNLTVIVADLGKEEEEKAGG